MNKSKLLVLMGILLIFGFTSCNKNGEKVTIKTNQPETVQAHYAKITGTIKSLDKNLNELQAYGCCLGKNPDPGMDELYDIRQRVDDYTDLSLPRPFEWNLGLLEPGTEYHFRAFAIAWGDEPVFGKDISFTTPAE
jgi:hypothetical protein